jgi:glycosyltransferase involved in cell wall biosynthesis
MPHISVVIPTYNRQPYLRRAVESCFDGNEGIEPEVVVVDDGSEDGTRAWLQSLEDARVRPLFQANAGAPRARNRGLRAARAPYVKFLDDDDWLAEGALEAEVKVLQQTEADLTYGQVICVDDDGHSWIDARPTPLREVEDWITEITRESLSVHPARFTYRRSLLEHIRWDPELPVRQDYDFALRVARTEPSTQMVDRPIYYYRQHAGVRVSRDSAAQEALQAHLDILVRHAQRLEAEGLGTPARWAAVAAKLWGVGRMIAVHDEGEFERARRLVYRIAPEFRPSRSNVILSWVDAALSPGTTEKLMLPFRKAKASLSSPR